MKENLTWFKNFDVSRSFMGSNRALRVKALELAVFY